MNAVPGTKQYARRLLLAKTISTLARPLNRLTLWAATVITEDRLRQQGMWDRH